MLVASPGVVSARLVQETRGRPLATLILQPGMIPSRTCPAHDARAHPSSPCTPLGRKPVLALGRCRGRMGRGAPPQSGPGPHSALSLCGASFVGGIRQTSSSGCFQTVLGRRSADWPPQIKLAGFPMYDGPPGGGLPPEILRFCLEGDPPVAFTFGTGMMHAGDTFRQGRRGLPPAREGAGYP